MSSDFPAAPTTCSGCGNDNRPSARFCDGCGLPVQLGDLAAGPLTRAPTPPECELKYGSVLFVDIVGSTEMVADRTPETAREILLPAITIMADAVEAYGGTLNQLLGDGVMALFGVPISQEDHALRACCAALRMHEAAAALPTPFRLRIGIASGLALFGVGEAGTHPAFGATIHLASRLQALAQPGATLVTDSTVALTGATTRSKSLGRHTLRGFTVEQEIFALTALEPEGTRFSNTVARGLSPLVGRADELAHLTTYANAARAGIPIRIGLVGEAGVGKSRLAWELARKLSTQGWQIIQADAISYGRDIPLQLVANLLCAILDIPDRTAPAAAAAIRARLAATGNPALSAPAILSLLDLPLDADAATWNALHPLQRRQAVDGTLAALLGELFGDRATLVLIEDLQWADDESLRLVDLMLTTEGRLMLLGTLRPEIMSPDPSGLSLPWPESWTEFIHLRHLELDSMVKLLVQAFPGITDPDLRQTLIARSAGNPFFLEELARDFLRSTPADGAAAATVPPTVQAVVAARIDRLDPEAKSLLVTASAFGTRFPARLLHAMAGRRTDIRVHLELLVEAGLLRPMPRAESEITFSHALIQEIAYAGLPRLQCRDLHARIVGAIKRIDGERLPEMAETLTYHAGRGEVWDELIVVAGLAGDRAAGRSAYGEAARFYHQAIEASTQLRRTPDIIGAEIDLRFRLRAAIFPTAAIARSLNNSLVAEALARSIADPKRLGWATAYVAKDFQLVGRPGEALDAAARTVAMASPELGGDPHLLIAARYFAAQAYYSKGNYAETADSMHAVIDLLTSADPALVIGTPGPTIFFSHIWLTWAEARRGRFRQAQRAAETMRQHAEAANSPLFRTLAALSTGFALAIEERFPEAEDHLRHAIDLSRRWELSAWFMNIAAALGHVLSRRGAHAESLDLLGEAVTRTRNTGILVGHAHELAWQAEAHLLAGQPAAAEQSAREAIDQARQNEERGNQAEAHLILAEALLDLDQPDAARTHAGDALILARACGMEPTIARCHITLERLDNARATA